MSAFESRVGAPGHDETAGAPDSLPAAVDRWDTSGGTWRVANVGTDFATVALCRCDGGEVAEWLTLKNPVDVQWAAKVLAVERSE